MSLIKFFKWVAVIKINYHGLSLNIICSIVLIIVAPRLRQQTTKLLSALCSTKCSILIIFDYKYFYFIIDVINIISRKL